MVMCVRVRYYLLFRLALGDVGRVATETQEIGRTDGGRMAS